jgi:hypothetical protein
LDPEAALMTNSSGEAGSIAGARETGNAERIKDAVRSVSMTAWLRQEIADEPVARQRALHRIGGTWRFCSVQSLHRRAFEIHATQSTETVCTTAHTKPA